MESTPMKASWLKQLSVRVNRLCHLPHHLLTSRRTANAHTMAGTGFEPLESRVLLSAIVEPESRFLLSEIGDTVAGDVNTPVIALSHSNNANGVPEVV